MVVDTALDLAALLGLEEREQLALPGAATEPRAAEREVVVRRHLCEHRQQALSLTVAHQEQVAVAAVHHRADLGSDRRTSWCLSAPRHATTGETAPRHGCERGIV